MMMSGVDLSACGSDFSVVHAMSGGQSVDIPIPKLAGRYGMPKIWLDNDGKLRGSWIDLGDELSTSGESSEKDDA